MKKSERLNDMIRYLNSREFFNLNDLMDKYHISKVQLYVIFIH